MPLVPLAAVNAAIDDSDLDDSSKSSLKTGVAASAAPLPDTWIYRIVVGALGLALFVPLVALLMRDSESMKLLLPIATGALGALAGLLAPSPAGR